MTIEQYLLAYQGFSTEPGVCHLLVARDAPDGRAALVGDPEDNPGTSPTNALERVAAAIAEHLFAGRSAFRLYQYEPHGLPELAPTFYAISWQGGVPFSKPAWDPVDPRQDPFLDEARRLVRESDYTLAALRGWPVIDATERASILSQIEPPAPV